MATNPVIIVTGAASGIGRAITETLLENGARVVLVDLREPELKNLQEEKGQKGVQFVVGDITEDETSAAAVEKAIKVWGRLDAVALNAGIMAPVHRVAGGSSAQWTRIFSVNVCAHVSMVCHLLRPGNATPSDPINRSSAWPFRTCEHPRGGL